MKTRSARILALASLAAVALAACGPDGMPEGLLDDPGAGRSPSTSAGDNGAGPSCLAGPLLERLGSDHILIGAQMEDETAAAAPFDLRYMYLAGGLFEEPEACTSCRAEACAPSGWWGCWQYDQLPPGQYLRDFLDEAEARRQLPMITYYEFLQASGATEGPSQLDAATDTEFMRRYFADWRFVLETIGRRTALLHIEPDLWGYAQARASTADQIPAAVASANPRDCAECGEDLSGVARCMVSMARKYAPNAVVGLHASSWATANDAFQNRDPNLDVEAEARSTTAFLESLGAKEADFIALDPSDRDAGFFDSLGLDRWWDADDATLPDFEQGFAWSRAVTESLGKPALWWQLPLGNSTLSDEPTRWRDNRVEYLFDHLDEVANANIFGLAFGAGAVGQTTPETDGGLLLEKTRALDAAGGHPACGR